MIVLDASAAIEWLLRTPRASANPHDFLLPRVWELRHNLTAYDAVYVALAEALGASLVTRDASIAAASGHHAQVDVV